MGYYPTKKEMEAARALNAKGLKLCRGCDTTKNLDEFGKGARSWDGLQSRCKACENARKTEYKKTDAGKAVQARATAKYRKTDAGKAVHARGDAKYRQTDAGKAALARAAAKSNPTPLAKKRKAGVVEYYVYLAELTLNETVETVAKIGSTHLPINRRFGGASITARLVASISCGGQAAALKLEKHLQDKFAPFAVEPKQKFKGSGECFNIKLLNQYHAVFNYLKPAYESENDHMFFDDRQAGGANTVEIDFESEVAA